MSSKQASDLAVVVCQGLYHTPAHYEPLIKALRARGIDAYCPHLPTSDMTKLNVGDIEHPDFDREPPPGGYPQGDDDARVVVEVLRPLIDAGKNILLMGHSAGGFVATEAALPGLQAKVRAAKGLSGGIIGIFYMGAFVIPIGESVGSFFQPKDAEMITPPFMTFHASCAPPSLEEGALTGKHGFAGLGTIVEAEKYLFNDLDPAEANKWQATLVPSTGVLTAKLTNDAYAALPCAYLVLDGDMTLPKEYQEGMIALQASKTGDFTVYHCPAGHSPHLSWTEGVVDSALNFVKVAHT